MSRTGYRSDRVLPRPRAKHWSNNGCAVRECAGPRTVRKSSSACEPSPSRKPDGTSSGKRSTSMEFLKYRNINYWPHPLATDMSRFFEKWQQARGAFAPTMTRHDAVEAIRPDSPARLAADAAIECINCGVCYAACDTVRWNPDFLGPAALNRAWTLVNDERDAGDGPRLAAVASDGGCHACHSHQSCQEHCPVALNPTASIAGLKRRTIEAYLRGEI